LERFFEGLGRWLEVEWWVRVADGKGEREGWLLVNGSQAEILGREF
jgi:hypothetical protein